MLPSVFQVISLDRVNRVVIAPNMHDAIVFAGECWGPVATINYVGPLHGFVNVEEGDESPSPAPEGTPLQ